MHRLYLLAIPLAIFLVLALVYGPARAWLLWKRFGHALGDGLARVVLTAFYFTVFVPFAVIARRSAETLDLGPADAKALWRPATPGSGSLDEARRQF